MPKEFYMVHVLGGGIPEVRHFDKDIAHAEAERLAEKTGKSTFVLVSIRRVNPKEPTPLRVEPTNVTPFGPSIG